MEVTLKGSSREELIAEFRGLMGYEAIEPLEIVPKLQISTGEKELPAEEGDVTLQLLKSTALELAKRDKEKLREILAEHDYSRVTAVPESEWSSFHAILKTTLEALPPAKEESEE